MTTSPWCYRFLGNLLDGNLDKPALLYVFKSRDGVTAPARAELAKSLLNEPMDILVCLRCIQRHHLKKLKSGTCVISWQKEWYVVTTNPFAVISFHCRKGKIRHAHNTFPSGGVSFNCYLLNGETPYLRSKVDTFIHVSLNLTKLLTLKIVSTTIKTTAKSIHFSSF